MQENEALFAELESLLRGAGITLVELVASRHRSSVQVKAVVYSSAGTGIEECSKAHRLIYPRLQILLETQDPHLEVTSPGIDRSIHASREWEIFVGKGARVLLKGGGEWIRGRIARADHDRVVLACLSGERAVELAAIAKARLDSSQEGD